MRRALVGLAIVLVVAGCSGVRDPSTLLGPGGAGTIVVDARLIVGQRFPLIDLRRTESLQYPSDRASTGISGARIKIYDDRGDSVIYTDYETGKYRPWEFYYIADNVLPHTVYHFEARLTDGRVVTAQTTTPDSFHVREWLLVDPVTFALRRPLATPQFGLEDPGYIATDSVYYTPSNQLIYQDGLVEARFDRGSAVAFQMALFNLENNSPLLLDADFVSQSDLSRLERESSSPPLDAPDGYVRLPWAAVWYQGRHQFVVYSVDRNWYDLARSIRFYAPEGLGFGTNAGDDLEKPIFHIEGGIGLFGSAAMDWTGFTVWPKPASSATLISPAPSR